MADLNIITPIEEVPEVKGEKGPASLVRRSLVALATAVALSGTAVAQTTPVRAEGGTVASSVVPNAEYDNIIAAAKAAGKDVLEFAMEKGKNDTFIMSLDAYIASKGKQATVERGHRINVLQAEIDRRAMGILTTAKKLTDSGAILPAEIKADIVSLYNDGTYSPPIKKFITENFAGILREFSIRVAQK